MLIYTSIIEQLVVQLSVFVVQEWFFVIVNIDSKLAEYNIFMARALHASLV